MSKHAPPTVAVVDYGLGNLFSVKQACHCAGLQAHITSDRHEIAAADAIILPGVGAFGNAMHALRTLDLVGLLRDVALTDTPIVGICLGLQLFMTESEEFGSHEGLNLIDGRVRRLPEEAAEGKRVKVPHVGWNRISAGDPQRWAGSLLDGVDDGEFFYFVHSYYAEPSDEQAVLSETRYASTTFCSAVGRANLFGCQFHPERSGPAGLRIYRGLAHSLSAAACS